MAELLTKKILFQGNSEIDQIDKIFKVLGSPTEKMWPGHKQLEGVQKASICDRLNFSASAMQRKFKAVPFCLLCMNMCI